MNRKYLALRLWVCMILAAAAAAGRFLLPQGQRLTQTAGEIIMRDCGYMELYSAARNAVVDAAEKIGGLFSSNEAETAP